MGSMDIHNDSVVLLPFNQTRRCEVFDGDQSKCTTITVIGIVIGSISLVACLFIFFIQWLYKKYQVFVQRLILYLTLASLLGVIIMIMGDKPLDYPRFCVFQGWANTFASWSSLAWACAITFNLYMNAVLEKSTDRLEWLYHLICWGLSFIISLIPFASSAYGPAGAWCWVKNDWEWRFGIWYCPFIIIIIVLMAVYGYIIYKVNAKVKTWQGHFDPHTEQKRVLLKKEVMPLRIYPLIYLALAIFPLINRIYNAVTGDALYGLVIMHAIFNPLLGAMNALVFCLDKGTIDQLHWSQLKLAFHRRLVRVKTEIYEYPAEVDTQPAVAGGAVQHEDRERAEDEPKPEFTLHETQSNTESHI